MLNTKPPTTFPNFELKITKFIFEREKIYENKLPKKKMNTMAAYESDMKENNLKN